MHSSWCPDEFSKRTRDSAALLWPVEKPVLALACGLALMQISQLLKDRSRPVGGASSHVLRYL